MKNAHGVEPTRYWNIKGRSWAIGCDPRYGPKFFNYAFIDDNCDKENSCCICKDYDGRYECHPIYKESLYVNTAGPDKKNFFTVLDYEVYAYE